MNLGFVLPWPPIEYVMEACAKYAVDDSLDGRALAVTPSGVIDINEDVETGYGGERLGEDVGERWVHGHTEPLSKK